MLWIKLYAEYSWSNVDRRKMEIPLFGYNHLLFGGHSAKFRNFAQTNRFLAGKWMKGFDPTNAKISQRARSHAPRGNGQRGYSAPVQAPVQFHISYTVLWNLRILRQQKGCRYKL